MQARPQLGKRPFAAVQSGDAAQPAGPGSVPLPRPPAMPQPPPPHMHQVGGLCLITHSGLTKTSCKVPPCSCIHQRAPEPVNSWAAQVPSFSCNLAHVTEPASFICGPSNSFLPARRTPPAHEFLKGENINHVHCPVQTPGLYSGVGRPPPPHLAFGRPVGWPQPLQGHLSGPGPPGMMGPPPPHAAPGAHQQQWRPRGQGEPACSCWHLHVHDARWSNLPGPAPAACRHVPPRFAALSARMTPAGEVNPVEGGSCPLRSRTPLHAAAVTICSYSRR